VLRSSYAVARARHTVARQEAYDGARDDAIAERVCGPELRITDIDAHALATRERTWSGVHPSGAGGWNWPGLVERLPSRAAVLPIAIWYGNDLCGLALGQASRHRADGCRHTVTLTYVERRPEPPPVQLRGAVLYLAISAARFYGAAVGARRLRLRNPDRNLLWYYETLGFKTVWKSGYPVYSEQEI
jgi:hypothetical protein